MKVKTISYSESREELNGFGLKKWKKLGMEAELEDGDELEKSIGEIKDYVRDNIVSFDEKYQNLGVTIPSETNHEPPIDQRTPKEKQIDSHKNAINLCSSKESLERIFKNLVSNTPELQETYNNKLKTFE